MAQAAEQTTIDLTLDDNTPPPALPHAPNNVAGDDLDYLFTDSEYEDEDFQTTAPPFTARQGQNPTEPITISDSDDEDTVIPDGPPPQPPESPEIQWVGQRQLPRRLPSPHPRNLPSLAEILHHPNSQPQIRRATPPELRRADAQSFRETLRNVPTAVFDFGRHILGAMGPVHPPMLTSNLGHLHWNRSWTTTRQIPTPLDPGLYDDLGDDDDDYAAIDLDYHDVGFPMGGLEIIDPGADEAAAAAAAAPLEDAYKPPPAARTGFTRDIQEDSDVLVCVGCEDELAVGEDDLKQQVWVSRSCGHVSQHIIQPVLPTNKIQVYCGLCASQRSTYRNGNDRDRKKTKMTKIEKLKECKAPGCGKKLTSKTAMFQVYL